MEEPSLLHPQFPSSTYHDLQQNDSEPLAIPPFDDAMLNGDLSFPEDFAAGDFSVDDYLNFNLDDLEFAEDLLLDPGTVTGSGLFDLPGSDHHSCPSQPPASNSDHNSFPEPHAIEGFDHGASGQGFNLTGVSNSEINRDPGAPRVSDDSTLLHDSNRDRGSSGPVPGDDSGNRVSSGSIGSINRSVACVLNWKLNHSSPESVSCNHFSSQGSGDWNCGDNPHSPDSSQSVRDVSSSFSDKPMAVENYSTNGPVECTFKIEDVGCKFAPKRKKKQEDGNYDTRNCKSSKPSVSVEITNTNANETFHVGGEEHEKKKARLMRNRESAQLSRQRKKQYVEELEDKVRSMHSTITDLNSKISYIMAENASLRQQLSGGGMCPPPPPGMYPMAPMVYPWMPCPPYAVKPQGSQVPLVPIPRLKPQQPAPAPKAGRKTDKSDTKKSGGKTKNLASISLFGLLFFILLVGGLVPLINVRYGGGIGETVSISDRFSDTHKGRILMVDGHLNRSGHEGGRAYLDGNCVHKNGVLNGNHCRQNRAPKEQLLQSEAGDDRSVTGRNSSELLVASLYVPRNDKLVQIDGNLIIHSVLASDKAMASCSGGGTGQVKKVEETSLAIARNTVPTYHVADRQRALGSGSGDNSKSPTNDGSLQQWFREGLAGPMLSSGLCTEVFQFDVLPTHGSIVPVMSMPNSTASSDCRQNSTWVNRSRNRRILHDHPVFFDSHALNVTEDHDKVPNAEKVGLDGNKSSSSSLVVSVLVDPREAGDGEGETLIRFKSLSRIFVVVLVDGVKYVTYSCVLPLMGSGHHLVTA